MHLDLNNVVNIYSYYFEIYWIFKKDIFELLQIKVSVSRKCYIAGMPLGYTATRE